MSRAIDRLQRWAAVIAIAAVTAMGLTRARAAAIVSIGNGPAAPDGSYLNAGNIANTLSFTNVNVAATTSIGVVDSIDLSNSAFGPTFFNLNLQAPTFNLDNNMSIGAGNVGLPTVSTVYLTGKITTGATLLGPSRFSSNSAVTQVNVLANTASIQQAVDISSTTSPVTVAITTGQYNETVSINRSITVATSAPAGHANNGDLGIVSSAASVTLSGTAFSNASGGTVHGIGTLDASALTGSGFVNHGVVAPGLSAGILSFTGAYNQASDGDFQIEIGGTTAGAQYDRLAITGNATLAGELQVFLISGFTPSPADSFTILTASTRTGVFSNAPTSIIAGAGIFDVSYTPTSVVLGNFHPVPEPALLGSIALFPLVVPRRLRRTRN